MIRELLGTLASSRGPGPARNVITRRASGRNRGTGVVRKRAAPLIRMPTLRSSIPVMASPRLTSAWSRSTRTGTGTGWRLSGDSIRAKSYRPRRAPTSGDLRELTEEKGSRSSGAHGSSSSRNSWNCWCALAMRQGRSPTGISTGRTPASGTAASPPSGQTRTTAQCSTQGAGLWPSHRAFPAATWFHSCQSSSPKQQPGSTVRPVAVSRIRRPPWAIRQSAWVMCWISPAGLGLSPSSPGGVM